MRGVCGPIRDVCVNHSGLGNESREVPADERARTRLWTWLDPTWEVELSWAGRDCFTAYQLCFHNFWLWSCQYLPRKEKEISVTYNIWGNIFIISTYHCHYFSFSYKCLFCGLAYSSMLNQYYMYFHLCSASYYNFFIFNNTRCYAYKIHIRHQRIYSYYILLFPKYFFVASSYPILSVCWLSHI